MVKGLQAQWGTCSRTVSFDHAPQALAYWKDLVAVGLSSGDIIILDAITGIHMSVLSSHTKEVNSLALSVDGTFLVSGSNDKTVNLWDVQTGGIIKTFYGHTDWVYSVSISPDCAMVASGSRDRTIRLWDVQTGECHSVIDGHNGKVYSVSFSPVNPQLLISASHDTTIRQWDVDGHQIGSSYEGNYVTFSSDGTHIVSWNWKGRVATVLDFDSGGVVAELQSPDDSFQCCCFSPDGKFVVGGAGCMIYIWDITGSEPYLVETLTEHNEDITSLIFSNSLISSSEDESIKFWKTGASSADPVATDSEPTPLASVPIVSVSLQVTKGIAISSDSAGVVKTWDILTGLCKASFQTPAKGNTWRDTQLIGGRLALVWLKDEKIYVWDLEKGETFQTLDIQSTRWPKDFRMSEDGSKVFLLYKDSIQSWSIQTGEISGEVMLEGEPVYMSLIVDGSRVWVQIKDSHIQGWDFGLTGSTPVPLSNMPPSKLHLCFIGTKGQHTSPSRIENIVTSKEVFRLSGRYTNPLVVQWDGQYLVTGYESGEVLILDFTHMIS